MWRLDTDPYYITPEEECRQERDEFQRRANICLDALLSIMLESARALDTKNDDGLRAAMLEINKKARAATSWESV